MTHGLATVGFASGEHGTHLAHLHQANPLRVMFPHTPDDEPLQAALITTSGGLVGGDIHDVRISADRAASAMVVGQAAEKVYRSDGADCRIDIELVVAEEAWLEWLPQDTILFDGARLRRHTRADLTPGGRLLAGELIVFGRTAMGETVSSGLLHDEWQVSLAGRALWADAQHWDEDAYAGSANPVSLATLIYVGGTKTALTTLRDLLGAPRPGFRAAATCLEGILVARWLGTDHAALRTHFAEVWSGFRHAVAGWADSMPRLWHV